MIISSGKLEDIAQVRIGGEYFQLKKVAVDLTDNATVVEDAAKAILNGYCNPKGFHMYTHFWVDKTFTFWIGKIGIEPESNWWEDIKIEYLAG